jgi:hypothetical protein
MTRLDTQRLSSRLHARPNARKMVRGYDVLPHTVWGEQAPAGRVAPAAPGTVYPAEATITASDAPNAAKLTGLGYVAVPQTAWTTGQKITIGTFDFNWTGSAWAAGAHA